METYQESGIGRRWKSLEEELAVLRHNPRAHALVEDLKFQDTERINELFDMELREDDYGQADE